MQQNKNQILQAISSKIGDISRSLEEIYNPGSNEFNINQLIEILNTDPTVYACCQLKAARLVELMGEYANPDKKKQKWIEKNIANMEGSMTETLLVASTAIPFGLSAQEILFDSTGILGKKEWVLKGFNFLDPSETSLSFESKDGKVIKLLLRESERKIAIPMWKVLHVVNGLIGSFGRRKLFGFPELLRIAAFVKLKQYIYGQLAIAARTRATGVLVGKTHSNIRVPETILDHRGRPIETGRTISAAQNLFNNMRDISNYSIMVADKNEEIFPVNLPAGERFWSIALDLCKDQINKGLLVPGLLLDRPAGSYALSDNQLTMFDANIKSICSQIQDQLIEKVFKPLIIWNFGRQEQYGVYIPKEESSTIAKSNRAAGIYQAIDAQIVDRNDGDVVNIIRDSIGLEPLTTEERAFREELQQKLQNNT